jgi:hypothetical protein
MHYETVAVNLWLLMVELMPEVVVSILSYSSHIQ